MTDYVLSCDTFARLSNMCATALETDGDEFFRCIRIDNGVAVATNRHVMAMENIGGASGIVHVIPDPALVAQCKTEAGYGSKLTITVNEMLRFGVAKTTLGYITSVNVVMFPDKPTRFDIWRTLVDQARLPLKMSQGGMYWNTDMITRLAASSPSGDLFFEEFIDVTNRRPTIIRDRTEYNWCGLLQPNIETGHMCVPAKLPEWL